MLNSLFDFPKPKSDDVFEDIICDVYSREFQNPNLQRYGRSGQTQNGIDIVGVALAGINFHDKSLVAIQCKNHLKDLYDNKLKKELLHELNEFETKSIFVIKKYIFVTSNSNSTHIHDFVDDLNKKRVADNKFQIEVIFWSHITKLLDKYPDLLYKYFTKYLPTEKAKNLEIADLDKQNRVTSFYSSNQFLDSSFVNTAKSELKSKADMVIKGVPRSTPHFLYVGFTSKNKDMFDKLVDLSIDFSDYYSDSDNLRQDYADIVNILKNFTLIISDSIFSKEIVIYLDVEISLAVLIGRVLRKNRIDAYVVFKDQIWSTKTQDTPLIFPDVSQSKPVILDQNNADSVALSFNASRNSGVEELVLKNLKSWSDKPIYLLSYILNGHKISSSSHAISVAKEISQVVTDITSQGVKHLHLFLITPKPLSLLMSYLLGSINADIHIYFLDKDRNTYLESGILTNNTF